MKNHLDEAEGPGWANVQLQEVAEVRLGRQRSPSRAFGEHMRPYVRSANITWGGLSLTDIKKMDFSPSEVATFQLEDGDILLTEASGSPREVGKPAMWRNEIRGACFQNTVIRVRTSKEATRFIYFRLLHDALTGRFADASRGVGIHHLGAQALSEWQISLPSKEEQERICSAIEEHFSKIDTAAAGLVRIQENLKQSQATLIQEAVEGRLLPTAAEQARELGEGFEPASAILERIRGERRRRWEEAEAVRLKGREQVAPKNWKDKYVSPVEISSYLYDPPEGWCWTTLGAIAEIQGGIQKGKTRSVDSLVRDVPYLRVANVQRGYLDLTEVKTIQATESEILALRLQDGDILFNEGGDRDKLGRGWVWRDQLPECIHQNHVFRARLWTADVIPEFVSWYANSAGQKYFLAAGKQTTNLASINRTKLAELPILLPPVSEQRRICEGLERQHSDFESIGKMVSQSLQRCSQVKQAILSYALHGSLTEPEPGDEPASLLVERLRTENIMRLKASQTRIKEEAALSRLNPQTSKARPGLLDVLDRTETPLSPEELFSVSKFSVDKIEEFFQELRELHKSGALCEKRTRGRAIHLSLNKGRKP